MLLFISSQSATIGNPLLIKSTVPQQYGREKLLSCWGFTPKTVDSHVAKRDFLRACSVLKRFSVLADRGSKLAMT